MTEEKVRFALAMRIARVAMGMSQQEFADVLGVAKSTVARNETLEMAMRADTLTAMLRAMREHGIEMDVLGSPTSLSVKINEEALNKAAERLSKKK
ncbi:MULTISPECIES: helix-turn-helix domain-containing protein [Halomonadaceae]|uniref:helix-turn-helix domain-containing protein n=1 Tax=Halomonadaceae TaxID=28256 RepID=UPI0009F4A05D|nr:MULTISPECIES: helix-turn-helix transcriptional regulator [Halomonadaceae]MEA2120091.1 helix-turn-helix transcriptional regulator [Halovibrio sp. HP20-59]